MSEQRKKIVISEVIDLLHNGYTRTPEGWGSTGYNPSIGSIQEFYGITDTATMTATAQMRALFQHPKLKNQKTRKVVELPFDIVDEEETTVTENTTVAETVTGGQVLDDAETTVPTNEFETREA